MVIKIRITINPNECQSCLEKFQQIVLSLPGAVEGKKSFWIELSVDDGQPEVTLVKGKAHLEEVELTRESS